MLFINNKYTRWYYNIIQQAQSRNYENKKIATIHLGYVESHHIIPKCMGGTNIKTNLIFLTAREHFICHLLLCHMVSDPQIKLRLFCAVTMFKKFQNNKNSKFYSSVREKMSKAPREWVILTNKNPEKIRKTIEKNTGRKNSPDAIQKFIECNTGNRNPQHGKIWINDGIINKLVSKEMFQSDYTDWNMGRLMKRNSSGKFT